MQSKDKILTILGLGGGGSTILAALISQWKQINLVFNTFDDGGDTGLKRSIAVELMTQKRSAIAREFPQLGNAPLTMKTPGDLRNAISRLLPFMYENGEAMEMAKLISSRSTDFEDLASRVLRVANILKWDEDIKEDIGRFLEAYVEDTRNLLGNSSHEHSIGNTILFALDAILRERNALSNENEKDFSEFLTQMGLLPSNIRVMFITEEVTTLEGTSRSGIYEKRVVGESVIDHENNPISPESFRMRDMGGSLISGEQVNQEVITALKESDVILRPPGSPSNSATMLNILAPEIRSTKGLFACVGNLFRNPNDGGIEADYLHIRKTLGLNSVYLLPTDNVSELIDKELGSRKDVDAADVRSAYIREGKSPIIIEGFPANAEEFNTQMDGNQKPGYVIALNVLNVKSYGQYPLRLRYMYSGLDEGKFTIRHSSGAIATAVSKLSEIWDEPELADIQPEGRYLYIQSQDRQIAEDIFAQNEARIRSASIPVEGMI